MTRLSKAFRIAKSYAYSAFGGSRNDIADQLRQFRKTDGRKETMKGIVRGGAGERRARRYKPKYKAI